MLLYNYLYEKQVQSSLWLLDSRTAHSGLVFLFLFISHKTLIKLKKIKEVIMPLGMGIGSVVIGARVYRNNLKNREFDKKAPQNLDAEQATIAERQGAREHPNFEVKPTQSKTDSSGCFGIRRREPCQTFKFNVVDYKIELVAQKTVKGQECTICLEEFNETNVAVAKTSCGHHFHVHCLNMTGKPACPNCRGQFHRKDQNQKTTRNQKETAGIFESIKKFFSSFPFDS